MGSYLKTKKHRYPIAANAVFTARDTVWINATGYAAPPPAPNAGVVGTVVGSAIADYSNTGGADGAFYVEVEQSQNETAFYFPPAALTIADVGKSVYIGATPKTITTVATNAVAAGRLVNIDPDDGRALVILPF